MNPRLTFFAASLIAIASVAQAEMRIASTDIETGKPLAQMHVLNGFGCAGENKSPQLAWSGAPEGTKSYLIMAYDPDAPTGSGWWHWTVFNIPANVTELPTGAGLDGAPLPNGAVQGRTDFGTNGYGGACPPQGSKPHRFEFTVYALAIDRLPVDETASGAMVGFVARGNSLDHASITAMYGW